MRFNLSNLLNMRGLIAELSTGLKRLNLLDNFEAFEIDITIADSEEVRIQHNMGGIPSRYLIVSHLGNGVISRGDTSWDRTYAYLRNYGPDSVTLRVIFYK